MDVGIWTVNLCSQKPTFQQLYSNIISAHNIVDILYSQAHIELKNTQLVLFY